MNDFICICQVNDANGAVFTIRFFTMNDSYESAAEDAAAFSPLINRPWTGAVVEVVKNA